MQCKKCGEFMPSGRTRCLNCGALRDDLKFCQHCGQAIDKECVVCPKCGKQVSELKQAQPQVIINNSNSNNNVNSSMSSAYMDAMLHGFRPRKDKWIAFALCLILGGLGAHKFYEGKTGMGILYLFTFGLFGIGWFIDLIIILCKPNPYYV